MNNDIEDSIFTSSLEVSKSDKKTEDKLRYFLTSMKSALTDPDKPRFRAFWKVKKLCLDGFKEGIHPTQRTLLWKEYTELLNEAHTLQSIHEKEKQFHVQQISLAIGSLGEDLTKKGDPASLGNVDHLKNAVEIERIQAELVKYQALKQRISSLRKEVIAMEIRISQKSKMLAELSNHADEVFPARKRLMQEITDLFRDELEEFFTSNFNLQASKITSGLDTRKLRSLIMAYQAILKEILIINEMYKELRAKLSQCWTLVQKFEKEKGEQLDEKAQEDIALVDERLQELGNEKNEETRYEKSRDLFRELRKIGLHPKAFQKLKKELTELQSTYEDKLSKALEQEKIDAEKRAEELESKFEKTLEELNAISKKAKSMKEDKLKDALVEYSSFLEAAKADAKRSLQINHPLLHIRWHHIKIGDDLPAEEIERLQGDYETHIQAIRSELPKCGLDIDLALSFSEMLEIDKERLASVKDEKVECLGK